MSLDPNRFSAISSYNFERLNPDAPHASRIVQVILCSNGRQSRVGVGSGNVALHPCLWRHVWMIASIFYRREEDSHLNQHQATEEKSVTSSERAFILFG